LLGRIIENWLTSVNERQYQIPFCQLLSAEGESVVEISSHHPHEKGKDIVTVLPDRTVRAYQLKAGRIDLGTWHSIEGEINSLVELPVEHPSIKRKKWHQPFLVTNGDITPPVIDQIRSKNESFRRRKLPRLELVVKGDLLRRFETLHGHYLPKEPKDFSRFLKLVLQAGKDPLDKDQFAAFLETVLPIREPGVTNRNLGRSLASATLLASYALHGCEAVENHWGIFEGWTMTASYCLAIAEKVQLPEQYWKTSFELCTLGAQRALQRLLEECRGRSYFAEGDFLTDGHFFRYRLTLLMGLLSAWALIEQQNGQSSTDLHFVSTFVAKHLKESTAWGESAIPFYSLAALLLEQQAQQPLSEALASNLIALMTQRNRNEITKRPGFPNAYYSPEAAVRLASGLDPTNLENFAGFIYTVQPLVDFLARRWKKYELTSLWYSITRMSMQRFEPGQCWEWLTWRCRTGKLVSTFAREPQKWSDLVAEAEGVDTSSVPPLVRRNPAFLAMFILVFPHRYDRAVQKVLEDWCFSRNVC
jgi:hypothetical protein